MDVNIIADVCLLTLLYKCILIPNALEVRGGNEEKGGSDSAN